MTDSNSEKPTDQPAASAQTDATHNPVAIILVIVVAVVLVGGALLIVWQLKCNPMYSNVRWEQAASCQ